MELELCYEMQKSEFVLLLYMCIITFEIQFHGLQMSTLKSDFLTRECTIEHLKLKMKCV